MASQDSLSALLHLQGLPPLPKSLIASYEPPSQHPHLHNPQPMFKPTPSYGRPASAHAGFVNPVMASSVGSKGMPLGPPPRPPPRPNSRTRASSTNSSFRTSPENHRTPLGLADGKRSSPLSLSSSPYPDSGVGRSSADSMSEPKAFVRVVKAPQVQGDSKLDAQLSQLRKDMQHLRQQDMALLGHLLQIHQGIQDLRNILVPPPQPAPSSFTPLSMFQTTPAYPSRQQLRKQSHPPSSSSSFSKLSMFQGANKFFSRRSSADKLSSEAMKMNHELTMGAMGGGVVGTGGNYRMAREDELSDSLSSLEFGDV